MNPTTTILCSAHTKTDQCERDATTYVDGLAACPLHHESELLASLEAAGARINWIDDEPIATVPGVRATDLATVARAVGIDVETI